MNLSFITKENYTKITTIVIKNKGNVYASGHWPDYASV